MPSNAPMIGKKPDNAPVIARNIPRRVYAVMPLTEPEHPMAYIEVTEHELAFHRFYFTYRWIGKPWWPVRINRYIAGIWTPADLAKLPWPLRKIEDDPWYIDYGVFARKDGLLWWWAAWTAFRYAAAKRARWVYVRLIMTAMVWGLAWVPQGAEPNRRHLGKKWGSS